MTKIIAEMVIGTAQYRETNLMSDAQLGFWGAILGVVISAIVAFIVSKLQAKSAEKNLELQIQAEIEKVERQYDLEVQKIEQQYTFEQKRDNNNFIVKLRIENGTELISKLNELMDLSAHYYVNNRNKAKKEKYDQEKINRFSSTETKVSVLINYFPALRKEWNEILHFLLESINIYVEASIGMVKLTEEMDMKASKDLREYYSKLKEISNKVSMINDEILNRLEE